MTYHKTIQIKGRVFSEEDILRLGNFMKGLYQEGDYKIEFTVKNNNETWVNGRDLSIFESDYFKRKPIGRIVFEYLGKTSNKSVYIELNNSLIYPNDSVINIKSDDEVWFSSISAQLSDFIMDTSPQKAIWKISIYKISRWFQVLIPMVLVVTSEIIILSSPILRDIFRNDAAVVSTSIALYILFAFLVTKVFSALEKAYPCIEFQFGIEKSRGSESVRRVWGWVIPTLILPTIFFILGILVL